MKKRIIVVATIAACIALCAAVWPQNEPAEETPALPTLPAVIAAQPEVPEKPEDVEFTMPEEEKVETTEPKQAEEVATALEPTPTQASPSSEVQAPPEQNTTPLQEPEPARKIWSMCPASAG